MLKQIFKFFLWVFIIFLILSIGYWAGTQDSLDSVSQTDLEKAKTDAPELNSPLEIKNKGGPDGSATSPTSHKKNTALDPREPPTSKDSETQTRNKKASEDKLASALMSQTIIPESNQLTYTISVKDYLARDDAEELVKRLGENGYSAYILSIWDSYKQLWHGVRVGHYLKYDAAVKEAKEFTLATRLPAKVLGLGSLELLPLAFFEKKSNPPEPEAVASKK